MPNAEQAYLFAHALVRDAAYDLQPPAERALQHLCAARAMESLHPGGDTALAPVAVEIADHLRLAAVSGEGDPDAERRFCRLGGEHASRTHDHAAVVRMYGRLAEIGSDAEVAMSLQYLFIWTRQFVADRDAAFAHAMRLLRFARRIGYPGRVATALHYLAGFYSGEKHDRLNRRSFRIAYRARDWVPAGIALGNQGLQFGRDGDYRRAYRYTLRAIAIHRRGGNTAGVAFFLSQLSTTLLYMGKLHEALDAASEAVAQLNTLGRHTRYSSAALSCKAAVLLELERHEEAIELLAEARTIAEEMHDWQNATHARLRLACGLCLAGRIPQARAEWQAAVQECPDLATLGGFEGRVSEMRMVCNRRGIEPFAVPPGYEIPVGARATQPDG
ncbi:MAG: hypothetical protein H6839_15365 [Planctomycetes bacterium]|nr:hypothetical protein [Planctomycetota bacterium]